MPSEKSRYRNRGPSAPVGMNQLRNHLNLFTQEHLIEIVWLSAQSNSTLWKSLSAHIGILLANGDWEKTVAAVDFALYLPDVVRYTEHGHGIIIFEMINALEILYEKGNKEFALRTGEYILESGQAVHEYFEDDWEWSCALEDMKKWICNKK
ncbi:MAG: hypothetical protein A3F46_10195 [Legionellales bacterium RIFCSPHIGHO2_12_FULL_42_9]|nr:MAG: hypothetical protein A3F46_10195 [Legionellales bacterium RIFCSPHIGHO2_12_FULL_42_9]